MASQSSPTRKNIQDLLFNPDPEQRRMAAEGLGRANLPIANEGDALEALTGSGNCLSISRALERLGSRFLSNITSSCQQTSPQEKDIPKFTLQNCPFWIQQKSIPNDQPNGYWAPLKTRNFS